MRWVMKLQSFCSNSSYKLSGYGILHLRSHSRTSKLSQPNKPNMKHQTETIGISSLFNEITEILGAHDVIPDKLPSGISISKEMQVVNDEISKEFPTCGQAVCGNAQNNMLQEKENAQIGNVDGIDVSPIVHEITEIVRAENGAVSMDERLEKVGFRVYPDIVEKVLKRCFKVPHLALRFFNWVKLRDGFCHTTGIYNTMLYIAGEAKEFGVVEKLIEEMEKNKCEKDIKTWTILVSQYGKAKLISKALLIFEKMRKCGCEPDVAAYQMMIRSLCSAGKAEIALEFYKEMVQMEVGLDLCFYKMLLNCLAKSGDINAVRSIADDMMRVSQIAERDVYLYVLKSFCVSGRIREALELIRDLKNKELPLDYEYFENLVKGLCRADRIEDALEIVDIMRRRHFVDGKVYGIIINGYLRRKDISKALELFHSMNESGYLPTTSTYTDLMQHLFKLNEYQKGCELYLEMLKRGVKLDSVAIMAMVAGHISQHHISDAWKVFMSMEDKGIRPAWKTYSIFIKELCKASEMDEIIKVLKKMQASKTVIRNEIFQWVIHCMEAKGDVDNAEKVKQIQRICKLHPQEGEESSNDVSTREGQGPNTGLNYGNQTEQGKVDRHLMGPPSKTYSEKDLQEICKILSSATEWRFIQEDLEKCAVQFTPELVVEILRNCSRHGNAGLHFFSWVRKQAGYIHTTETYNMAIKIAGSGKDFKHMRSLFYDMKRNGCLITPDTWAIMIMQYGRTGLTDIALRTFGEMKASGCNPNGSTYKFLIISLCERKGRKVDEAIKVFQEMIRTGHIPDKELVENYLHCLCEVDKLLEAKSCVDSICKAGFTTTLSYSMYVRALCRTGKLEEALSLVEEARADRLTLDQYVCGSLVHGLLQKGRLDEALAKVDLMKEVGIHPTVHVYTSLIVYFLKEKQTEKALEIFEKMRLEDCEPTIVTYSALIRGYMNAGKVDDAWNVFNRMKQKGPVPDFKTYSMFISCLCRVGQSEEAMRLIFEMLNRGIVPSTVNFRTVFYGLNREGKQDLARTVLQQKLALMIKRKFMT